MRVWPLASLAVLILGCKRQVVNVEYEIINPYPAELLFIPNKSAAYPQRQANGSLKMVFDPSKPIEYNPATWPFDRWCKMTAHDQYGVPITMTTVQTGAKFEFSIKTVDGQGNIVAVIKQAK